MKRELTWSNRFVRDAKQIRKRSARLHEAMTATIELLAEDAFHPKLKTHKLKGGFVEIWSSSAGYDLRVLFQFVKHADAEKILLLHVGTHKEVY